MSSLGLIVFQPDAFFQRQRAAFLAGDVDWVEIKRDDTALLAALARALAIVELPTSPPAHPACGFCRYRSAA